MSVDSWRRLGLWDQLWSLMQNVESFSKLCFAALAMLDCSKRSLFSMTLCSIQCSRNEKYWDKVNPTPMIITTRAHSCLQDWLHARNAPHNAGPGNPRVADDSWSPPSFGFANAT